MQLNHGCSRSKADRAGLTDRRLAGLTSLLRQCEAGADALLHGFWIEIPDATDALNELGVRNVDDARRASAGISVAGS